MARALSTQDGRSGVSDFGYINVRIKGTSLGLFKKDDWEKMIRLESVGEMETFLQNTDYAPEIRDLKDDSAFKGTQISLLEKAFQRNLIRSFSGLKSLMAGEPLEMYLALVSSIDIYNLKTLLRGIRRSLSAEAIYDSLLPVGILSCEVLKRLSALDDCRKLIPAVIDEGLTYVVGVEKMLDSYYYSADLREIEHKLDDCRFKFMLRVAQRKSSGNYLLFQDYTKLVIDLSNTRLLLKMTAGNISQSEAIKYFTAQGKLLSEKNFLDMVKANDRDLIVKTLSKLSFCKELKPQLNKYRSTGDIVPLDRGLNEALLGRLPSLAKYDPLGISVMMKYLEKKQAEIVNLRVILHACDFGMPQKLTREELVFV